jgi:ABC-type glutathione transport system ATPase component
MLINMDSDPAQGERDPTLADNDRLKTAGDTNYADETFGTRDGATYNASDVNSDSERESESEDESSSDNEDTPQQSAIPVEVRDECIVRACKTKGNDVSWCSACRRFYCSPCWELQTAHEDGPDPHEKTDPELQKLIRELTPRSAAATDGKCPQTNSKWFGVRCGLKNDSETSLDSTNRYNEIAIGFGQGKYPSMVSFVGETGQGKSTLISALLKVSSSLVVKGVELSQADLLAV